MNETIPIVVPEPVPVSDDEIRDYAYHLYVQNGHRNDQCGQNWLEARACLSCRVPKAKSGTRLHDAAARIDGEKLVAR
jgi:hypothetical protein